MDADFRRKMRDMLRESYKHKEAPGERCVICGSTGEKLAYHIVEFSRAHQSAGGAGFEDGSYPVCTRCARPCKKCGLPVLTTTVKKFFENLKQKPSGVSIHIGNGICQEHTHLFGLDL